MWGSSDAEPMLCVGSCFKRGLEFMERRRLARAPEGIAWVRNCPACYAAGWRLAGDGIEAGRWWSSRYGKAGAATG